jgi:site-specific DNA-methyltransferase (adenine-specific)
MSTVVMNGQAYTLNEAISSAAPNGLPPYSGFKSISEHGRITLIEGDCMELLRQTPDKAFDLAIVDPPYGINGGGDNRKAIGTKSQNNLRRFGRAGGLDWDRSIPQAEYWQELFRVSKHQIVWGGNYFLDYLPATRCLITWDKMTYIPSMSQIEIAWTSFNGHSQLIKINSNQSDRFHPTQKPVALYRWLLKNYAKPGQRILDTHLGSGSIAIACDIEGFDLVGTEIDHDYITAARKRLADHQAQPRLFEAQKDPQPVQITIDEQAA